MTIRKRKEKRERKVSVRTVHYSIELDMAAGEAHERSTRPKAEGYA